MFQSPPTSNSFSNKGIVKIAVNIAMACNYQLPGHRKSSQHQKLQSCDQYVSVSPPAAHVDKTKATRGFKKTVPISKNTQFFDSSKSKLQGTSKTL